MRVGVLGSGMVGQALARGFAGRGNEVRIGSREPAKLADFAQETDVGTGTFDEVAAHGELLVLATRGDAAIDALALTGQGDLDGKVLIDTTNPLAFSGDGPPELFVGWSDSLGEQIQRAAPGARVVKCFNIITAGEMVDPDLRDGPPTMFLAGDDDAAKETVIGVLHDFGWPDVVDVGRIEGARLLEPLCLLWVVVGARRGAWDHGFRLLVGSP